MIRAENLTKQFEDITALNQLNTSIQDGSIYGLVGSNGAGKSTLLRLIAGVFQPSSGSITIDDNPIYENISVKGGIAFVPDDLYFLPGASMESAAEYLSGIYESWSPERYKELVKMFPLAPSRKLATCSKGMRRQAALILALASMPKYLLLDEAFDGLDPMIRVALRKILSDDVSQRGTTVLISSHNLRELEDSCDQMGLLHSGNFLLQKDIDTLKFSFCKVQLVMKPLPAQEQLRQWVELLSVKATGNVAELIVRGSVEQVTKQLESHNPLLCEGVPLTLEEIFIYEMEAVGYDYNNIIF